MKKTRIAESGLRSRLLEDLSVVTQAAPLSRAQTTQKHQAPLLRHQLPQDGRTLPRETPLGGHQMSTAHGGNGKEGSWLGRCWAVSAAIAAAHAGEARCATARTVIAVRSGKEPLLRFKAIEPLLRPGTAQPSRNFSEVSVRQEDRQLSTIKEIIN